MTLRTQVIDVHPPRATGLSRRFQRFRATRTSFRRRAASWFPTFEARMPVRQLPDTFTIDVLLRCILPGWAQFYLGRRRRGMAFAIGAVVLASIALIYVGSGWGNIALGLLFSTHAASIADALTPPGCRVSQSIAIGLGTYLLLGTLIYLPAMRLLGRIAQPIVLQRPYLPFREGDVLLVRNRPVERGNIVYYDQNRIDLRPGGRVTLRLDGPGIDRVLAVAGDAVTSRDGVLKVNGVASPLRPINLNALPDFELTVPPDYTLIFPSLATELPTSPGWQQAILVPVQNIHGTAVWQTYPFTHFGPVQ